MYIIRTKHRFGYSYLVLKDNKVCWGCRKLAQHFKTEESAERSGFEAWSIHDYRFYGPIEVIKDDI